MKLNETTSVEALPVVVGGTIVLCDVETHGSAERQTRSVSAGQTTHC